MLLLSSGRWLQPPQMQQQEQPVNGQQTVLHLVLLLCWLLLEQLQLQEQQTHLNLHDGSSI